MLSCVAVYKPNQLFFYSFTQFLNERLRYVSGRPNMAVLKPEPGGAGVAAGPSWFFFFF